MTNSFRIDATEVRAWHEAAAKRVDVRGVAALAKELEAHAARSESDGTVVVSRHQLFTWAEALHGAAARGAPELESVSGEMRAILSGKPADAPSPAAKAAGYAAAAVGVAPVPGQRVERAAPPPVVYGAPAPSAGGSGGSLVSGADLANAVRDLIRSARGEILIVSPWQTGVETLVQDLVALPEGVRIRIVSRRPDREEAAFHKALDQLGRRRAVTAFSNHIQTRMIVQDGERALVGAAGLPGPASREAAILVTDRASVAAVRAHVERVHAEAAGGAY